MAVVNGFCCGKSYRATPSVKLNCPACGMPVALREPIQAIRPIRRAEGFSQRRLEICLKCPRSSEGIYCDVLRYPERYAEEFPQLKEKPGRPGVLRHSRGIFEPSARCPAGEWGAEGTMAGRYMRWSDLSRDTAEFASMIAKAPEIKAIAGVPRSGLVVASQLALQLGLPLYAVTSDGLQVMAQGVRSIKLAEQLLNESGRILVIDDSVNTGNAMLRIREMLSARWDCIFGAIYCHPAKAAILDVYHSLLPMPHFFEWHFWGCQELLDQLNVATDFDGVLCPDFLPEEDDDGARYLKRMREMPCLVRPHPCRVPAIVTGRLEKYRAETEAWLERHAIAYGELIMGPWESIEERQDVAQWKASVVAERGFKLFVESDPRQATIIAEVTRVPVICPEIGECLHVA